VQRPEQAGHPTRAGWPAPPARRVSAQRLIRGVDLFSYWSGKASAWLIVALTFVVSIEVFKRYILNAPTSWIFDFTTCCTARSS